MGRTPHAMRWEQLASNRADRWRLALLTSLGLSAPLFSACSSDANANGAPAEIDATTSQEQPTTSAEAPMEGAPTTPPGPPASRANAPACPNTLADWPPPDLSTISLQGSKTENSCTTHADCTATPYGACLPFGVPVIFDFRCDYGCVVDTDCGEGQICLCGSSIGHCATANCYADADCGTELRCLQQPDRSQCGGQPTFHCQTTRDGCATDSECGEHNYCNFIDSRWQCEPAGPVCGRPFLVAARERRASLRQGKDWQTSFGLSEPPAPELSAELAAHWTEIALMEHASVAAFSRFTLQLLQFGAPAELVQQSVAATADEIEHARLAFTLARHYASREVEPGTLSLSGALSSQTLAEVVELVLHEGCVGETLAAFEAAHAAQHCRDPELRGILARIADDEQRHAELAWSFVRWALGRNPSLEGVVARVRAELGASVLPFTSDTHCTPHEARLLAHGVVSKRRSTELRAIALGRLVLPCLEALWVEAKAA